MTVAAPPRPAELGCILAEHEPMGHALSRFIRKIEERDGHWLWRAATIKVTERHEYGYFHFRHAMYYAHRWAYEAFVGPIPEGYTIDHLCRVTLCVYPAHLEAVPLIVNIQRGERQTHTPLSATKPGSCKRGHSWNVENTYLHPTGKVYCRPCHAERNRHQRTARRDGKGA